MSKPVRSVVQDTEGDINNKRRIKTSKQKCQSRTKPGYGTSQHSNPPHGPEKSWAQVINRLDTGLQQHRDDRQFMRVVYSMRLRGDQFMSTRGSAPDEGLEIDIFLPMTSDIAATTHLIFS